MKRKQSSVEKERGRKKSERNRMTGRDREATADSLNFMRGKIDARSSIIICETFGHTLIPFHYHKADCKKFIFSFQFVCTIVRQFRVSEGRRERERKKRGKVYIRLQDHRHPR